LKLGILNEEFLVILVYQTKMITSLPFGGVTTTCSIREPLRRVNDSILEVLGKVTISQMTDEAPMSEVVELRV